MTSNLQRTKTAPPPSHPEPVHASRGSRLQSLLPSVPRAVDLVLVGLLLTASFLLGCCELYDGDVWWHLAGGYWILEHGRAPGPDPFTFGSADQVWVDLNWLFELVLAFLYDHGGLAAIILLIATLGTAALLTAWSARQRSWPVVLGLVGWVPGLVLMSSRFLPRPEVFTLLFLAVFLAVIWRASRRPALLWILPPVQVLWVNTHGLFILGPLVLLFHLLDRAGVWLWRRGEISPREARRERKHLAAVAAVVVLACLLNPYRLDGALLPFVLLPKVTAAGNVYKRYIAEFASPRDIAQRAPGSLGLFDANTRAMVFLLLMLPVSFVLPAAWKAQHRAAQQARKRGEVEEEAGGARAWLGALTLLSVLALVAVSALPGRATAQWMVGANVIVPVSLLSLGGGSAWLLWPYSRSAAAWALSGTLFEMAWLNWLRGYLLEAHLESVQPLLGTAAVVGTGLAVGVVLSRSGGLLRLLLAGAFGYLALNAVRNGSLFGLVAGVVLAWNLGEWFMQLRQAQPEASPGRWAGWALRLGGVALLSLWVTALATDNYYPWTGQLLRLGLDEKPFLFAHDAARFAAGEGLPEHAFVLNIMQAGVYDFHNGPARKTFMDPRLEVPSTPTFERFVALEDWLRKQNPRWHDALHGMGDPLVMVWHPFHAQPYIGAEAALLTDSKWRCVYFDSVASVFIPRHEGASTAYPDVDFAGRLFRADSFPLVPSLPGAALREAEALLGMAGEMRLDKAEESRRTAVVLGSLGRTRLALREDPESAEAWSVLGDCQHQVPAAAKPAALTDDWDAARVLPWAAATYCRRHGCEKAPNEAALLYVLYESFRARQMWDAQLKVWDQLQTLGRGTAQQAEIAKLRQHVDAANRQIAGRQGSLPDAITSRLKAGLPEAAVQLAEQAQRQQAVTWDEATADRLAAAYLQLGRPTEARRIWEHSAVSSTGRLCRLAGTYWTEQDLDAAIRLYQQALKQDARCAEACWALAVIHTQQGQARPALEACRKGLELSPTDVQRDGLQILQQLLPQYVD